MKRIISIILLCILPLSGCGRSKEVYSKTAMLMSTFVEIKVLDEGKSAELIRLTVENALVGAENLQKKFDIFNPESEVNQLNILKKITVSQELFILLKLSQEISRQTGGKFDITVAPILKKEGFYRNMPEEIFNSIPDDTDGVGWENVVLDAENQTAELKNNAWIDLSGIAKGYIVDNLSRFLMNSGCKRILVNAGGDIFVTEKAENKGWTVGVRKPGTEKMILVLGINNKGVATSGDYENVIPGNNPGEIKSHIIDPIDRIARESKDSSVTVIAPTCTYADALSTAFMTMSKDEAVELADKLRDVEIIAVYSEGRKTRVVFSENAEDYVKRR